mmetsp:Transcript_8402/g.8256  ORF Transcript_8402/g.8256 Transcript_8402/m.8256 type:complete len:356 (+) Transcript_8402:46-1113(+)
MASSVSEEESLNRITDIVDSLLLNPACEPFYEPVDWRRLELFDYPQIIPRMIDLGTIKKRLIQGEHYSTSGGHHQVAEDIRLIWKNCMTYNEPGSDYWLLAKLFATRFENRYRNIRKKEYCDSEGCWKCSSCDKSDFRSEFAFNSHILICKASACTTATDGRLSMKPSSLKIQRQQLSDFNILVTASIELFELGEEDVARFAIRHRKRHPQCGDVGIRCVYCAEKGVQPPGSVSYPDNLKSVPFNVYNMTNRHLLLSCKNIPKHTQKELKTTKKITTSQSMEKKSIGLPVYLKMLVHEYNLTDDKDEKQGIQRIAVVDSTSSSRIENSVLPVPESSVLPNEVVGEILEVETVIEV